MWLAAVANPVPFRKGRKRKAYCLTVQDLVAALLAFAERLRLGHAAWSALAEARLPHEERAEQSADARAASDSFQDGLDQALTAAADVQVTHAAVLRQALSGFEMLCCACAMLVCDPQPCAACCTRNPH